MIPSSSSLQRLAWTVVFDTPRPVESSVRFMSLEIRRVRIERLSLFVTTQTPPP